MEERTLSTSTTPATSENSKTTQHQTLLDKIKQSKLATISVEQKTNIILQIIEQLKALNAKGLYYPEFSPADIYMDDNNTVEAFDETKAIRQDSLKKNLALPSDTTQDQVDPYLTANDNYTDTTHSYIHPLMTCIFLLFKGINLKPSPKYQWQSMVQSNFINQHDPLSMILEQFLTAGVLYNYKEPFIRFTLEDIENFLKNYKNFEEDKNKGEDSNPKLDLINKIHTLMVACTENQNLQNKNTLLQQLQQLLELKIYISCAAPEDDKYLGVVWNFFYKHSLITTIPKELLDGIRQEINSHLPRDNDELTNILNSSLYTEITNSKKTLSENIRGRLQEQKEKIESLLATAGMGLVVTCLISNSSLSNEITAINNKMSLAQNPGSLTDIQCYSLQKNLEDYCANLDKKIEKMEKLLKQAKEIDEVNNASLNLWNIDLFFHDYAQAIKKDINILATNLISEIEIEKNIKDVKEKINVLKTANKKHLELMYGKEAKENYKQFLTGFQNLTDLINSIKNVQKYNSSFFEENTDLLNSISSVATFTDSLNSEKNNVILWLGKDNQDENIKTCANNINSIQKKFNSLYEAIGNYIFSKAYNLQTRLEKVQENLNSNNGIQKIIGLFDQISQIIKELESKDAPILLSSLLKELERIGSEVERLEKTDKKQDSKNSSSFITTTSFSSSVEQSSSLVAKESSEQNTKAITDIFKTVIEKIGNADSVAIGKHDHNLQFNFKNKNDSRIKTLTDLLSSYDIKHKEKDGAHSQNAKRICISASDAITLYGLHTAESLKAAGLRKAGSSTLSSIFRSSWSIYDTTYAQLIINALKSNSCVTEAINKKLSERTEEQEPISLNADLAKLIDTLHKAEKLYYTDCPALVLQKKSNPLTQSLTQTQSKKGQK